MYALDTNSVLHIFKGEGRVAERLLATPIGEIAIPSIVLHEVEVGILGHAAPDRRRAELDRLLAYLTILPLGGGEARAAAAVRHHLERRGLPIGPLDTLIAGTALYHDATLVTRNVREFGRVSGLRVDNWYDSV